MKTYSVNSIDSLKDIVIDLLELLNDHQVVALEGQMGAGKTTFIQQVLKAMGIEELDGSPTYSLINQYESPFYGTVYHLDLYRLNSLEEIFDIGIEELLDQKCICLIEWPEKMIELLPDNTIWVYLRVEEDFSRTITIKNDNKS
ncbi:MAG: tRNA (adenosine(37)-N6)-threonylcarbamoyltransferase complex ATPase subunit type 1 TsaE [Crocinitomicaceae bacterium]|jgi:tRNA threonylcarbamoyladenosine biosynthesis protein TsaE